MTKGNYPLRPTLAQYVIGKPDPHGEREKAAKLPTLDRVRRFAGIVCNATRPFSIIVRRKPSAVEVAEALVEVLKHYEGSQDEG